ncbi:hypothetical protein NCCP1664_21400 [Zafaria cholistanensis]|uniref:Uncharacterized protein n=1 Tax=Zafaria cholistanensis TaxID=1682741 RepID=A0A5A7NS42_9MICC|nr:hypothetical protein [Zafaria cholistanensis]GER23645.1 hypothetical protein NCCP1664_21400 [Zafaria cholistanensis]
MQSSSRPGVDGPLWTDQADPEVGDAMTPGLQAQGCSGIPAGAGTSVPARMCRFGVAQVMDAG